MTTNPLESAYRHTWWALVLRGLLSLALGGLILWRPLDSVAAFALVIAIWALFGGLVQIVHGFEVRSVWSHWWTMLLSGLVSVGFGVAALYYYPVLSLAFAVVWTTWWLCFTGALAIFVALQERQAGLSWGWTLLFGATAIVAGVAAMFAPHVTLAAIMGILAGFAVVSGVVLLIAAYQLSSAKRDVTGALRSAPAAR